MTQEQFEALGIEKSLAKKAADASADELKGYVPKEKYDAADQQRQQAETSVADYKTQLETLKASAGDNETLKQQNADLQTQNQQKEQQHKQELADLRMTSAIKMAIAADAQDGDLVAGLVDRKKLILGDDGKVTGLDEQIKSLKESKPFLFKQEEQPKPNGKRGFFPLGPKEKGGDGGDGRMTMKEAIAARLNMNDGTARKTAVQAVATQQLKSVQDVKNQAAQYITEQESAAKEGITEHTDTEIARADTAMQEAKNALDSSIKDAQKLDTEIGQAVVAAKNAAKSANNAASAANSANETAMQAEAERKSNEEIRVKSEKTRSENEIARVNAEKERQNAETQRARCGSVRRSSSITRAK